MEPKFQICLFVWINLFLIANLQSPEPVFHSEEELEKFLNSEYEKDASAMCTKQTFAEWDLATDINNKEKEELQLNATLESADFEKEHWTKYFYYLNPDDYEKEIIRRQVRRLKILGLACLSNHDLSELTNITNTMTNIYSTAKICPFQKQNCDLEKDGLSLESDIEGIMASSTNYAELSYVWTKWRDMTGSKVKQYYGDYVKLSNKAARANKFNDYGEMWINDYESETFIEDMDRLWKQVEPLYRELHTYVKRKLKGRYESQMDLSDGLLPSHIFGNMWAQTWDNLYPLVAPFPNASEFDITRSLKEQNYTVLKMFEVANEFFTSMGLESNVISYDEKKGAMITKPPEREVLCHPSAWDFCDGENYRIKMCADVNYKNFITVHHEMGHIQYYLLYKNEPKTLRIGANPGFHEAVGDTIALSVATPKHLKEIKLLKNYEDTEESTLNALMNMALNKIAVLPFALLVDKWRWDVFAGKVSPEEWNSHWWYYRNTIQKMKPPITRSDETDFDPGAKFHVVADTQYINYFVSHILQFQMYRGLCKTAKQYDPRDPNKPLHKCDFYRSVEAGQKLRNGLSLGARKHWKDILEQITGERDLDATAILDYFKPLHEYLKYKDEKELTEFLENVYEPKISAIQNENTIANWNFATDVNNKTKEEAKIEATLKSAEFRKSYWNKYFRHLDENDYINETLKRQVKSLKILGDPALSKHELQQLTEVKNKMTNIYSTGKICPYKNQRCNLEKEGLSLDPDIENIMATSNNYDELVYVWDEWRKASGAKIKSIYPEYVLLSNKAANTNGYKDKGEVWRDEYESSTFIEDMNNLWEQVKPLYNQLHKYVGRKLKQLYGEKLDITDGNIPAHVFGNMWAQSWTHLSSFVKPYPNANSIDVTAALQKQNYTVLKMFETSDEFYKSLGLESNGMSYNENLGAVIIKPEDREILCHPSAWDFSNKKDFRIKMCTKVNYEDFITIHHEMGHIQYFIQYKDQLATFRAGANPGFHEAIGDTIALSVATPRHLQKIGLLEDYEESYESDINTLMDMALKRVAFLPFGLLIDKWRWDVFAGNVSSDEWNSHWWDYRKSIQKVKPPNPRSDATDFDPGAKYHVPMDSQYINYFIAHILQFQLYRELCKVSGQYQSGNKAFPLYKCDFYQSRMAGNKLKAGLSLGASKHWEDVLKAITDEKKLDATAMLEYFEPLIDFFTNQEKELRVENENELEEFLIQYEKNASTVLNELVTADWNFATDVDNPVKKEEQLKATLKSAAIDEFYWNKYFRHLNEDDYEKESLKRQLKFLKILGDAALEDDKLTELTNAGSFMTNIYSTAKICPFEYQNCNLEKEGLDLEPDIEDVMAKSEDYDELVYVWKSWRDATGVKMKDTYKKYVNLSNEAAKLNNFQDKGDMWRSDYESLTFIEDMDMLWIQVKPLYDELHRYITHKLKQRYEGRLDVTDGLIPAHVLGNMWAQSWINVENLAKPFPQASQINITQALEKQNYTILKMFETSDEFYRSLGLPTNNMSYDVSRGAVIEKPKDRKIVCHASAWDFSNKKDFRIKMCAERNYEDFITIHHEMGHIQYFIQYKDQPVVFQGGANPGFHEAVGDTIALSVATPNHLKTIGLLENYKPSYEADINTLMNMALERVAFLPFGLLIDKWRWDVFAGLPMEEWNSRWWHYRETIQKIKSPVDRSNDKDFDPGAKFHVPGDSQYINYFIAHILEFQLYRALCKETGEYDPNDPEKPLYKCDYYNCKKAGDKLKAGLSLGSSKHWKEVLEAMTGEKDLDASAILEYFEPLFEYLLDINGPIKDEKEFENFMKNNYEPSFSLLEHASETTKWNLALDIFNSSKQDKQLESIVRIAKFKKFYYENYFRRLKEINFNSEYLKRQLRFLKLIENAALDDNKLEEYTKLTLEMTNIYNTARICPYKNPHCNLKNEGLLLESGINEIIAKSKDYDELKYVWTAWRKESGAKIRDKYIEYVELSNEAAKLNGFQDKGAMWRATYETDTFVNDIDKLWIRVKPLYDELHTYVARRLKNYYRDKLDISDGLIPAHLLGDMWGQTWINLFPITKPYPDTSEIDLTSILSNHNYTVLNIFEAADGFYKSLGLESSSASYNESLGAIIEKPSGRDVLCHPSAWDFSNGKDFRIKMCAQVNYKDFMAIHHEMGHIQYFMLYKNQPSVFRNGANPAFHEAIGDTVALSATSTQHLRAMGLLKDYKESTKATINAQMKMALDIIAFLPFGLVVDKWRWDIFAKKVASDKWNSLWWHYRKTLQKIKPSVERSDIQDFDPGAYHVVGDSQYINYFVATILQFQMYRGLCRVAGKSNMPLHQCDFYNSKAVGDRLKAGLSLGSSKHWKHVLEKITGEGDLDASALLEYFQPLMEYLRKENGEKDDPTISSQLVPIVVGSILGVILVAGISLLLYKRCMKK